MSYKIKMELDYYDTGTNLFDTDTVTFNEGLTVLVGCNGYGKSTTIRGLKRAIVQDIREICEREESDGSWGILVDTERGELRNDKIRYLSFDHTGSHNVNDMSGSFLYDGKISNFVQMLESSEGQALFFSFTDFLKNVVKMKNTRKPGSKNFILIDGVDSGLSIDKQKKLRELFTNVIIPDFTRHECEIYIVMTTNSYELVENSPCMDAKTGKYMTFSDYQSYRDYILSCAAKTEAK